MWLAVLMWACARDTEDGSSRDAPAGSAEADTSVAPSTGAGASVATETASAAFEPPEGPRFDFAFQSGGYVRFSGATVYLASTWLEAPAQVAWTGSAVVAPDGWIDATYPDVLVEGASYLLYWYIDADGDGACSELPVDYAWSTEPPGLWGGVGVDIGPVDSDLLFAVPASDTYDFDGCAVFHSP